MLNDWNGIQKKGYGQNKREMLNQRIAQWKASGKNVEGGCYDSCYAAEDYHDAQNTSDLMTWNVLCARFGKQALPVYVLFCV